MNVIGKCTVELTTNMGDGLSLQKQLQEGLEERVFPRLERLFDRIADEKISIRIDSLELAIEIGQDKDWMDRLSDQIIEKMERNILVHIRQAKIEEAKIAEGKISQTNYSIYESRRVLQPGVIRQKPVTTIEGFIFVLEHGYLPWWSTAEEFKLEEDAIIDLIESSRSSKEFEFFKQQIIETLSHEKAVNRLLRIFPEKLFNTIISFLFPAEQSVMLQAIEEYKSSLSVKKLSELYLRERLDGFRKELVVSAIHNISVLNWKKFVTDYTEKETTRIAATKQKGEERQTHRIEPLAKDNFMNSTQFRDEDSYQAVSNSIPELFTIREKNASEEIFIHNAGLVIIGPFLPRLFQQLGWIQGRKLQPSSRAVHLLHYLASGNREGKEYEFVLNKILCGLEVDELLDHFDEFNLAETEEADKLLQAVIEHWKIIKNTSIGGLRESFLMRNGKLSRKENDWLLQVEQKSYDMLLESLPWSINLIRLPFMKASVHVEWT